MEDLGKLSESLTSQPEVNEELLQVINVADDEVLLSNRQELLHLVPSSGEHHFSVIILIDYPSVFPSVVKRTLKVAAAFLVFTLFGLVVKGMVLLFLPSMRL